MQQALELPDLISQSVDRRLQRLALDLSIIFCKLKLSGRLQCFLLQCGLQSRKFSRLGDG